MKTLEWLDFLEAQKNDHGKVLFRVAELANVTGHSHHAMNVELARLVARRLLVRYASGVYGRPGTVTREQLVATLDADAYITGMSALHRHNLITQEPGEITCFTNRRHNRARQRTTPLGRWVFVCVSSRIYDMPVDGVVASPEQALFDFVYERGRRGLNPASLVTFRGLDRLGAAELERLAPRYPATVRKRVRAITDYCLPAPALSGFSLPRGSRAFPSSCA